MRERKKIDRRRYEACLEDCIDPFYFDRCEEECRET